MDQEKIGKLIAKLRKSKGLTQRELGEKVGVGFRAVSKWENGITSPDISIINDLSKILGISADELLKGEVSKDTVSNNSNHKNYLYLIPILLVIILSITIIFINHNKTYVYKLETTNKDYYIEGNTIFKGNNINIIIDKISFENSEFQKTVIKNYQYELYSGNVLIVGYGYTPNSISIDSNMAINEFSNIFKINYNDKSLIDKSEVIRNGFELKITFLDEDDKEITKTIKIKLKKQK